MVRESPRGEPRSQCRRALTRPEERWRRAPDLLAAEHPAAQHAEAAGIQIDENVDRQSFTDAMVPLYPIVIEESRLQDAVTRIQAEH